MHIYLQIAVLWHSIWLDIYGEVKHQLKKQFYKFHFHSQTNGLRLTYGWTKRELARMGRWMESGEKSSPWPMTGHCETPWNSITKSDNKDKLKRKRSEWFNSSLDFINVESHLWCDWRERKVKCASDDAFSDSTSLPVHAVQLHWQLINSNAQNCDLKNMRINYSSLFFTLG